jgi:hypothetical protein
MTSIEKYAMLLIQNNPQKTEIIDGYIKLISSHPRSGKE